MTGSSRESADAGGAMLGLARVCTECIDVLGAAGAGISLTTEAGHRATVWASDEAAARIEELQFTLGEGPCVEAHERGAPVLVPDLRDPGELGDRRWPGFHESAVGLGIGAIFAFPLRIGVVRLGTMDLYRREPSTLSTGQLAAGLLAADAAAVALLHFTSDAGGEFDDSLPHASFRFEVHQAAGMLMVQLGTSIEDALLQLRAMAFSFGRPVEEVARDVLAGRLRMPREER